MSAKERVLHNKAKRAEAEYEMLKKAAADAKLNVSMGRELEMS